MIKLARADPKISLVLADVDGTLVTAEKVLTTRAVAAVNALQAGARPKCSPGMRGKSSKYIGQNFPGKLHNTKRISPPKCRNWVLDAHPLLL